MHCCLDAVLFSINDALLYILFILNELLFIWCFVI